MNSCDYIHQSALQGALRGRPVLGPPSPAGAPAVIVLLGLAQRCDDATERFAALQVRPMASPDPTLTLVLASATCCLAITLENTLTWLT